MPYIALEKRDRNGGFEPELEPTQEEIRMDGNNIEIRGWIGDDRRFLTIIGLDEIPEEARRKIAEEEIKKAAELLHVIRVAVEGEED